MLQYSAATFSACVLYPQLNIVAARQVLTAYVFQQRHFCIALANDQDRTAYMPHYFRHVCRPLYYYTRGMAPYAPVIYFI